MFDWNFIVVCELVVAWERLDDTRVKRPHNTERRTWIHHGATNERIDYAMIGNKEDAPAPESETYGDEGERPEAIDEESRICNQFCYIAVVRIESEK